MVVLRGHGDRQQGDGQACGELKAEKVLQAIGFAPNVEGYGLDRFAGGRADRSRCAIGITDYMQTSVPHIYAIGDVTGKLQLAHVAEAQGVVAAETIAGAGDFRRSVTTAPMPRATFRRQPAGRQLRDSPRSRARDEGYK